MSTSSGDSALSQDSTLNPRNHCDPQDVFNVTITDINFRASGDNLPITIETNKTVRQLLTKGPSALMHGESPQLRWIHLPANNMAWVEELMRRLRDDQNSSKDGVEPNDKMVNFEGVLRDDLWRRAFHGRESKSIHCRFMMPLASRYASIEANDPATDDSDTVWHKADSLVLYLPYLHWEPYNSWKFRQNHIASMKRLELEGETCKCFEEPETVFSERDAKIRALLHEYLFHNAPIHDRRTLEQSYFYNLRQVAHRDEDQIIGQCTWNKVQALDEARKMMMVDQLWLWVVNDETLITAFPQTSAEADDADVGLRLFEDLPRAIQQGKVRSTNGLIAAIIDKCTGVFQRSDLDPKLAFFEFFANEIGSARSDVNRMFKEFRDTADSVERLWTDDSITAYQMSRHLDQLFSIKDEIRLLEFVEKLILDLNQIDFICSQQESVVRSLLKCTSGRNPSRSISELVEIIESRRKSWADMAVTAKATHDSLHGLLDLKQRQAAVSEARSVRYQVEITAWQGQSIRLLTIFTTICLPISVIAAVFGMNARELNDGRMTISSIVAVSVPIDILLVLIVLYLAFRGGNTSLLLQFFRSFIPNRMLAPAKDTGSSEKA